MMVFLLNRINVSSETSYVENETIALNLHRVPPPPPFGGGEGDFSSQPRPVKVIPQYCTAHPLLRTISRD